MSYQVFELNSYYIIDFCRFDGIVANSSVLLNKFKLQLKDGFPKWKTAEILNLKRKLQTVEIFCVTDCHSSCCDALIKIFEKLGSNFREIHIVHSKLDDFTFRTMLKHAGMLETLTLRELSIVKKLPAINPVSMRNLQNLTITHSDWSIIKFINAQVKSFLIKSYLDEGSNKNNLISFFAEETLSMWNVVSNSFPTR